MRTRTPTEVVEQTLEALAIDAAPLHSSEVIAAITRVAAGFRCPCPERTLVDEVVAAVEGLSATVDRDEVRNTVRALISYGDLVEAETRGAAGLEGVRRVYARPPSFVSRSNGDVVILGVGEMDRLPLPLGLESRLERRGYARRISGENLAARLSAAGFVELSSSAWRWAPAPASAEEHLAHYDGLLDSLQDARDVGAIRILDSERPVDYYRGRWVEPGSESGRFLARRPRPYGSELWCYVVVDDGRVRKLFDLPGDEHERPCDVAWRLQAAIDAVRGTPQHYALQPVTDKDDLCLSFFSPVPQWAQRRWDDIGNPTDVVGALLSYELTPDDVADEVDFCSKALWLKQVDRGVAHVRTET